VSRFLFTQESALFLAQMFSEFADVRTDRTPCKAAMAGVRFQLRLADLDQGGYGIFSATSPSICVSAARTLSWGGSVAVLGA